MIDNIIETDTTFERATNELRWTRAYGRLQQKFSVVDKPMKPGQMRYEWRDVPVVD